MSPVCRDACLCLTHKFRVETLCKEAYSIYKKVKASGCEIEDVSNIAQVRRPTQPLSKKLLLIDCNHSQLTVTTPN
jgi:hypothetical protein